MQSRLLNKQHEAAASLSGLKDKVVQMQRQCAGHMKASQDEQQVLEASAAAEQAVDEAAAAAVAKPLAAAAAEQVEALPLEEALAAQQAAQQAVEEAAI